MMENSNFSPINHHDSRTIESPGNTEGFWRNDSSSPFKSLSLVSRIGIASLSANLLNIDYNIREYVAAWQAR